jgi:hypothetical protein
MKEIQLTQGKVALVDDEDYERCMQYKWCAVYSHRDTYYAKRALPLTRVMQPLASFIMCVSKGVIIDHIDNDGLNAQKHNLRVATQTENKRNARKRANTSSQYKGVSWSKRNKKWRAYVRYKHTQIYLGYFVNEIDAALAYDDAARKYYGEFARTNF